MRNLVLFVMAGGSDGSFRIIDLSTARDIVESVTIGIIVATVLIAARMLRRDPVLTLGLSAVR